MPFLCASLKHYPTNNPLEGVCLRPKAGGKPAKKKDGRSPQNNATILYANQYRQSLISSRCSKQTVTQKQENTLALRRK